MKRCVLILSIIPIIVLGQTYGADSFALKAFTKLNEHREELGDIINDVKIANETDVGRGEAELKHSMIVFLCYLDHAISLVVAYGMVHDPEDRWKTANLVTDRMVYIKESMENEAEIVTSTLPLIDNNYLIFCGDKLKDLMKKTVKTIESLDFESERIK